MSDYQKRRDNLLTRQASLYFRRSDLSLRGLRTAVVDLELMMVQTALKTIDEMERQRRAFDQ